MVLLSDGYLQRHLDPHLRPTSQSWRSDSCWELADLWCIRGQRECEILEDFSHDGLSFYDPTTSMRICAAHDTPTELTRSASYRRMRYVSMVVMPCKPDLPDTRANSGRCSIVMNVRKTTGYQNTYRKSCYSPSHKSVMEDAANVATHRLANTPTFVSLRLSLSKNLVGSQVSAFLPQS